MVNKKKNWLHGSSIAIYEKYNYWPIKKVSISVLDSKIRKSYFGWNWQDIVGMCKKSDLRLDMYLFTKVIKNPELDIFLKYFYGTKSIVIRPWLQEDILGHGKFWLAEKEKLLLK